MKTGKRNSYQKDFEKIRKKALEVIGLDLFEELSELQKNQDQSQIPFPYGDNRKKRYNWDITD